MADSDVERIGAYRIEGSLGRGGMGEVFLAWDERLERHVAIKRIRPDRLLEREGLSGGEAQLDAQRQRFRREARAAARLGHPAIVQVFDILEREEGDYIVMERVEGQSLLSLLARGPLDLPVALRLAREIADGLGEAHAKGLVHRDLKPENVLLSAGGHAKILDFGLARSLDDAARAAEPASDAVGAAGPYAACAAEDALTAAGTLLGTAHAMSPEQAMGQPVDPRSDLFAFGSLLYQMLTGEAPFRGNSLADSLRRVVSVEPPPPSRHRPEVPAALDRLVLRLLAKNPAARPQSARLVVAELDRLLEGPGPLVGDAAGADEETAIHPEPPDPDLASRAAGFQGSASQGSGSQGFGPVLRILVLTDLVGSTQLVRRLGDARAADLAARHDRLVRDLLARHGGQEIDKSDGFLALFERAGDAVAWALAYHQGLQHLEVEVEIGTEVAAEARAELRARVGIHLGEVFLRRNAPQDVARGAKALEVEGLAKPVAARVMALARGHQTLLTRGVFDLARRAAAGGELAGSGLAWLAHGPYALHGLDEPVEVFEVGFQGFAPLTAPPDSPRAKRVVALGEEATLGWRPAGGQGIPRRPHWTLEERLGEGGFGEVWSARHKTGERRIFKFCFDAERLRSLKREVTLFRLLRDALGRRDDIARILDWSFDEPPFFLEAEAVDGGDLEQWAERAGGLGQIPLEVRLELIAQVAVALHAAHSVGVLHKDVKPENVLVATAAGEANPPRALLTDFGIGRLTESSRLLEGGITALGFTQTLLQAPVSETAGTVRYLAPEVLEGKPATIQADVYALGVMLYQIVVGDFGRTLAPGWRREVPEELLADDVAACVDGSPELRLASAGELAGRLRSLPERRQRLTEQRRQREKAERARRRRRLATGVAAAASVLLVLVSLFAWQTLEASRRERQARQQSEQRRHQAERLIDFMLGDLREKLQPIGRLEILAAVGDQAMDYFAAVPEEDLSDDELRHHARALHQIGQVRFGLGRFDEAAEAFRESLDVAERLAALDPADAERQFELGQSHFWVGFLRWQQRDLPAALEAFEAYRRVSQELVGREPASERWQLELAWSHSNVGSILEEQGELEKASDALEASARILEGLTAAEDADPQLAIELAHVYAKLGEVLRKRGRLSGALARFEAFLDLMRRAAATRPEDFEVLRFLGLAHSHVGDVRRQLGDVEGAADHHRQDLEIATRVAEHDPRNLEWQEELTLRQEKMIRVFLQRGDLAAARRQVEAEAAVVRRLVEQAPEHPLWRQAEARQRWWQAAVHLREGASRAALESATASHRILSELAETAPEVDHRLWLARSSWLLGEVHSTLGETAEARELWRQAAEISAEVARELRFPEVLDLQVRSLLCLGEAEAARPLQEELAAMGYREPDYLAFLERRARDLRPAS